VRRTAICSAARRAATMTSFSVHDRCGSIPYGQMTSPSPAVRRTSEWIASTASALATSPPS
jgi:hypothetical protein